jgi:uncharacterized protein YkwD
MRLARRLLLPLTAALGVLAFAAPGAFAACANEDVAASDPAAIAATLCLLNQERSSHGLSALSGSPVLDRASSAFAEDMVDRGFFDHVSPGGGTMMQRLKAAGWTPSSGTWSAGENIAWGSGSLGTPVKIVDSWMHSAGHRANILNGTFTAIGIGIADGAPQAGIQGSAGTYVTDFTSGASAKAASCAKGARAASKRSAQRRCTRR